jgi:hypothetical protein
LRAAFWGGAESVGEESEFRSELGFELAGAAFLFEEINGTGKPCEERSEQGPVEEEEPPAQGMREERHQDSME